MPPRTAGKDLLVYLEGPDDTPVAVVLKEKLKITDMKSQYPGVVYLGNKNLHHFPSDLRGGVMWLPSKGTKGIVAVVIHAENVCAYVAVIHPKSESGNTLLLDDTRIEGCYLEQVSGEVVALTNSRFRKKKVDPETQEVVTRDDDNGCIKVNIHGPDIILTPFSIPPDIKAAMRAAMRESGLVVLDSDPLEKPSKRSKHSTNIVPIPDNVIPHELSNRQKKNREKSRRSRKKKGKRKHKESQMCGLFMSTVLVVALNLSM